jgi:limonene-1,2-epoxide hydrolase
MEIALRFSQFYTGLGLDSLAGLAEVYDDAVTFIDPVTSHRGLAALSSYFSRLLAATTACEFTINQMRFGDTDGWVTWTMNFRHPRLNRGEWIAVEGVSVMELRSNRIVFQRDYYDMGEMVYERVPLLGRLVRKLRERLA